MNLDIYNLSIDLNCDRNSPSVRSMNLERISNKPSGENICLFDNHIVEDCDMLCIGDNALATYRSDTEFCEEISLPDEFKNEDYALPVGQRIQVWYQGEGYYEGIVKGY